MSTQKSFTIEGYMVIEGKKDYYGGYTGKISRFVKSKPAISNREIAVFVKVQVPVAFFERLTPVIEIKLPEEAVVSPNIESVVKLTSLEVADKLQLEIGEVEDGLKQLIKNKLEKGEQDNG